MKEFRRLYLPGISIVFMYVAVFATIINILNGRDTGGHSVWLLQLLGYLIVVQIVNYLLNKVNFKSYFSYYIVENIIFYVMFIAVAYYFNWFSFNISNIIVNTIAFIVICGLTHYHFYKLDKEEADSINKELEKRNKKA